MASIARDVYITSRAKNYAYAATFYVFANAYGPHDTASRKSNISRYTPSVIAQASVNTESTLLHKQTLLAFANDY